MEPLFKWVAAVGALALLTLWLRLQIRYRLSDRSLRVSILGITFRRIPLDQIEKISKRQRGIVENWSNVWRPKHKVVVLHRKGMFRRPILITPQNRYIFIQELKAAQEKLGLKFSESEEVETMA